MKTWILVALAGCYHDAAPAPAAISPPVPRARPPVTLLHTWETFGGGRLTARTPAGPFGELTDICARLGVTSDGCRLRDTVEVEGTQLAVASVRVAPGDQDETGVPLEDDFVGIRVAGRWYVLPRFAEVGLRYSGLGIEPALVGDALVIRYSHTHGTKWSGDNDAGLVACRITGEHLSCTPKVPLRRNSYTTADRNAPGDDLTVTLACTGTYAAGEIDVAPMPMPAAGEEDGLGWSADAADACGGRYRVAF